MSKERRANKFICHDCNFAFEIFDPLLIGRNERKYCPKCGDHFSVKVLNTKKKPGENWDDYELKKMDEYMKGEIKLYTMVRLTGRSRQAIYRKQVRLKPDAKIRGKNSWKEDEKKLADICLNGGMTIRELSEKTGRSYDGAQSFIKRLKTEREKQKQKQGVNAK